MKKKQKNSFKEKNYIGVKIPYLYILILLPPDVTRLITYCSLLVDMVDTFSINQLIVNQFVRVQIFIF